MMFISVDLPEPDGPMIATNSPSSTRERDAAQRVGLGAGAVVDLVQVDRLDDGCGLAVRGGRALSHGAHHWPPGPAGGPPPIINIPPWSPWRVELLESVVSESAVVVFVTTSVPVAIPLSMTVWLLPSSPVCHVDVLGRGGSACEHLHVAALVARLYRRRWARASTSARDGRHDTRGARHAGLQARVVDVERDPHVVGDDTLAHGAFLADLSRPCR